MPPGVDAYNAGVLFSLCHCLEDSKAHAGIISQVHEGYHGTIAAPTLQTFAQPTYSGGALLLERSQEDANCRRYPGATGYNTARLDTTVFARR